MLAIHPGFILDEEGRKVAVRLSMDEWNCILDELEELEDIRDEDKRRCGVEEFHMRRIHSECPWRKR